MADLAELGIRFTPTGAAEANRALDDTAKNATKAQKATDAFAGSSTRARKATDDLTGGLGRANSASAQMNAQVMKAMQAQEQLERAMAQARGEASAMSAGLQGVTKGLADLDRRTDALRASIDPLAAAIKRTNADLAEAQTLYKTGALRTDEYTRYTTTLQGRLKTLGDQHKLSAKAAGLQAYETQNLSRQFADVAVMAQMGMSPMSILMTQGTQIGDIFQTAAGRGVKLSGAMKDIFMAGGPIIGLTVGFYALGAALEFDATTTKNAATEAETYRDVMAQAEDAVNGVATATYHLADARKEAARQAINGAIADNTKEINRLENPGFMTQAGRFLMGQFGEASAAEASLRAENLRQKNAQLGVEAINLTMSDKPGAMNAIDAARELQTTWKDIGDNVSQAEREVRRYHQAIEAVRAANPHSSLLPTAAQQAAMEAAIRAKYPEQGARAAESHAAALGREAAAIEATIQGNLDLAKAYGVSGEAAMRAEATAKATAAALTKQGDIEAFVARQIRLSVSEQAVAGAKAVATLTEQTAARRAMNEQVATGRMTIAEANAQLANESTLRQQIAAAAVAEGADKAQLTENIKRLRAAQADANAVDLEAKRLADNAQMDNQLEMLAKQLSLVTATNRERAIELAQLAERQAIIARGDNPNSAASVALINRAGDVARTTADAQVASDLYNASLTRTVDLLNQINTHTHDMADGLARAFDGAGQGVQQAVSAIGTLVTTITDYGAKEAAIQAQARKDREAATLSADVWAKTDADSKRLQALSSQRLADIDTLSSREMAHARQEAYGNMISAAKGFFDQGSDGYRVLQAAEAAYRAFQMASTIQAMILSSTETAKTVADAAIKTTADTAAGGAKMFSQLGIYAFPAVAAMVAVMASLGASGAGASGSIPGANDAANRQAAMGTGSILGDANAKSDSINRSLEIVAANSNKDLEFSNSMLTALRSIDNQIGTVTAALARGLSAGGMLDTSKLNLGESGSGPGLLTRLFAPISNLLPGLFGSKTTTTLQDQGVQFNSATLGQILSGGLSGNTYQQVLENTKKKFFGFTYSDKNKVKTATGGLDSDFLRQTQLLIGSLRDGIVAAASVLGVQGAQATLNAFTLNLGKLSFQGMSSDEIQKALESVFSKAADDMAAAVIPGLASMEKAGEGLFETLSRVAREYQVVDVSLQSIGKTFNGVGVGSIAARDRLVQAMGGMDNLQSATDAFASAFLTDAQKIAPIQAAVTKELQRLGIATDISREGFANLVQGIDVSTAAGAQLFASLMAVAPALDKVLSYSESLDNRLSDADLATKRRSLEIDLMTAQGRTLDALNAQRADELAGMDDRLRALQQAVYAAQDQAQRISDARQVLTESYNRESAALDATASRLRAQADALAQFRQELSIGPSAVSSAEEQYRKAKATFSSIAGLAVAGDETAMGQLRGAGTTFLDASKAFATNAQDVLRDRAAVLRAVDAAAATATTGADTATQQLTAMQASVSGLIELNQNTVSVHDAIVALQDALVGSTPAQALYAPPAIAPAMPVTAAAQTSNDNGPTREDFEKHREETKAALIAIATNTSKTARESEKVRDLIDRLSDGGDAMRANIDTDTDLVNVFTTGLV